MISIFNGHGNAIQALFQTLNLQFERFGGDSDDTSHSSCLIIFHFWDTGGCVLLFYQFHFFLGKVVFTAF